MNAMPIALTLAARGWPVFPCNAEKKPSISKREGGRGFHDATRDPDAIRRMFSRRSAVLVGVPTGEASGVDVLDIDPRHGGHLWEACNRHRLPETRIHETMSGGRHWLFIHVPGVRNSASKQGLASGVDVRGEGGYCIVPPSAGYRVIADAAIAHWPDWLLQPGLVLPRPMPARSAHNAHHEAVPEERLQAIIDRALDRVRRAPDGQKHYTLRNMALLLGGIAVEAGLSDADLTERLLKALPDGVKDGEAARKTAEWGLENGRGNPLDVLHEAERRSPDPRRRDLARAAFRLLRRGVAEDVLLLTLGARNRESSNPLIEAEVIATARWAMSQMKDQANAA
jgi:hypothetical protein